MEKSLFRVMTRGCGIFYVIATTFDYAAGEVTRELDAQDYGYSGDRVVTNVEFICREMAIEPGEPADLCRRDFVPLYRKLGRGRFLEILKAHQQTSDK